MKKSISVVALLSLAGCVTFGQMHDGLTALKGQPLSAAIAKIGLPSSESTVAGMRVVKWKAANTSEWPCEITMQVDDRNIIQAAEGQGNIGGCERYIKALKSK
nr:hypothetical protein [Herbaspirillum sp. ASV7]